MNITFKNIKNQSIERCFIHVLKKYPSLHPYDIILEQKPIKGSTMQAQPVIRRQSLLSGINRYKIKLAIYVRDSQELKVKELPEEVLIGWFAHELGHVVDYESYSVVGMAIYGIRYLLSDNFKKKVEHEADFIAIRGGFRQEIIAAKRFLLERELVSEDYKRKIQKLYMPIEMAQTWEHQQVPGTPDIKL